MSYTTEVKEAMCKKNCELCCRKAELYGFLLFSSVFSEDRIKIRTENEFILNHCIELFELFQIKKYRITEKNNKIHFWLIEADGEVSAQMIHQIGDINASAPLHIDYSAIENECCANSFLRGVFLGGGYVLDPKTAYNLEIRTGHQMLADDLIRFCDEIGLDLKSSTRRGIRILYMKNSESIKDFFAYTGAPKYVLDFAAKEMEKSLNNDVNRVVNCEQANIVKSVGASQKQIRAIERLKKKNFDGIPEELRELAELRLQYPELTMTELGEKLTPKLSKSGVAHRMKKLTDFAKTVRKKKNTI